MRSQQRPRGLGWNWEHGARIEVSRQSELVNFPTDVNFNLRVGIKAISLQRNRLIAKEIISEMSVYKDIITPKQL
jgi:hypothetical protein